MASDPAIIVTRPSGQARRLIELIREGSQAKSLMTNVIGLPLLTIVPKSDPQIVVQMSAALAKAKLVVFVSPNAIECTMRALADAGMVWSNLLTSHTRIGVVGSSSRDALLRHGVDPKTIVMPAQIHQSDSEGLWQSLQTHIDDWQTYPVLILKGEGGRESLMDHLQTAGASVEALSIYTRIPLDASSHQWQVLKGLDASQTLWLLTSSEAVRHLAAVRPIQQTVSAKSLVHSHAVCSHHNIAKAAKEIGFGQVSVSDPGDESITQAALVWLEEQVRKSPSPRADDR
jgi:uroporphyrinogen-III synthase